MLRAVQNSGQRRGRVVAPLAIFAVCAAVYLGTLGPRVRGLSDNAHYVYLAQSFLNGQLSLLQAEPPGNNDWAHYNGRWYVAFPPFPALLIAPLVAIWGTDVWDRAFWGLLAGFAPALLYVWLRLLRERGHSQRGPREDLLLCALFAFGSPYYYTSVQGTVWFAAHVVTCTLCALFLIAATDARRPWLAGCALGLAFMTRGPTLSLLALFFLAQVLTHARQPNTRPPERLSQLLAGLDVRRALGLLLRFCVPLLCALSLMMWMNAARFDDPFEPGYSHLRIRWQARIETWGLFNYHYLGRNMAVMLCSLPWISATAPYLKISRHGLALWVTTPHLLWALWPKRHTLLMTGLGFAAGAVAFGDLLYQNSGWIQFGYRFGLDYMLLLIGLLALGGRRFGAMFHLLAVFAFALNLFGALTFDRDGRFYDTDSTQRVIFQPD